MSAEAIEGTATEIDAPRPQGQELVRHAPAPPPTTLFRTEDPIEVLEKASKVATALKAMVDQQGLIQRIGNHDHPKVEAWQTLGAMLGVSAIVVWTRPIEPPTEYTVEVKHFEGKGQNRRHARTSSYTVEGYDWECKVEARTLDGRVIGAAESMCSRKEDKWQKAGDYALRSMAQTRATSRALAQPLRFVMGLAGYDPTPAEEMDQQASAPSQPPPRRQPPRQRPEQATAEPPEDTKPLATPQQRRKIFAAARDGGCTDESHQRAIFAWVAHTQHSDRIPKDKVKDVIEALGDYEAVLAEISDRADQGVEHAKAIADRFLKADG